MAIIPIRWAWSPIADAIRMTIEDPKRNCAFASDNRSDRWNGRVDPGIGQYLGRRTKAKVVGK